MHRRRASRSYLSKIVATGFAFALVSVMVAACGTDNGATGGVLRYGYDFDAQWTNTFDVSKSQGDCDQIITSFIYDSLLHKTPGGKLEPGLASSWTIPAAAKGRELDLTLRPGLKFSNGKPLDAEAVGQALIQNGKNPQLSSVALVKSYKVVDPTHIKLMLSSDQAIQVLYSFAGNRDGMVMEPASFATADQHPVGAGPFMLKTYNKGAEILLVKNPNYWDKSVYKNVSGLDFLKVATGPPTVTALKAGDVDMIRAEVDTIESIKSDKRFAIAEQATGAYMQLEFRLKNKDGSPTPFAKLKVRQAFEYGIDRKQINQLAQDGLGEVTDQPFPKGSPVHDDSLDNYYSYKPDKARQLLAEAGYPNGFTFEMVIPGGGIQNMENQAAGLQQQLKKIGVTAKVVRILPSNIATGFYIQRTGDAFAAEELASTFPGGSLYSNYGIGQYVASYDGAEHPEVDALMLKAQSTTDINETYKSAKAAAGIAVKQALDVPIAFAPQFNAYDTKRVSGKVGAQTNICDPPDLTQMKVSG